MESISIRNTVPSDLPLLPAIEKAAGEAFRAIDMANIADHAPPSLEELSTYHDTGHSWVAAIPKEGLDSGEPVAYILVYVVDNDGFGWKSLLIYQISVSPEYSRRGIGKTLINHVALWAFQNGMRALDLTTFANVLWNKPYYERLGFRMPDEEELLQNEYTGLRRLILCEWQDKLLGRWPRVAMRRHLYS